MKKKIITMKKKIFFPKKSKFFKKVLKKNKFTCIRLNRFTCFRLLSKTNPTHFSWLGWFRTA